MKQWLDRYSSIRIADLVALGVSYAIKITVAIVLLIIGIWFINRFLKVAERRLHVRQFDTTYKSFTRNLLNIALKTVLVISILNFAGFRTTSVIALLGAAGLAVGLALQGTLTNFAGGVLLVLFKPFKVGDVVEAQGKRGVVTEIQIFTTIVTTEDNRRIYIPNSMLSNGIIENHTDRQALPHEEEMVTFRK